MSAPPLRSWVGVKPDGEILYAHCNCMAGAGEACLHIAALLYTVITGVRMQQETAITFERCQWLEATGPVSNFKCTGFVIIAIL